MDASALSAWNGPAVALLDLDAFFASVEQLDHPEWRGRPVIVGGSSDKRGVVSTASYEARRFGVHSAMPSWQAERLCPQAIWTRGHYSRYREMSRAVMQIILDETPLLEQVSIDEAFFDVTPGRYANESPLLICRRIQERVSALGVTCSIGLGTNKTIAKIASERQKPRGITVVPPGGEAAFLAPLPTKAMSGIGKASAEKLQSMGIHTLGQLAAQDPERMRRAFGVQGPRMIMRAAGLEESRVLPIDAPEDVKSVSNERTFAHDITTQDELLAAVDHVSSLVGARLRRKELKGRQVTVKLKFDIHHTHTAQRRLAGPTDDEHDFAPLARELALGLWKSATPVRLVGVALSEFGDAPVQLDLFGQAEPAEAEHKRESLRKLSAATDAVRAKFGTTALSYGRDLRFKDEASDTVPLNKSDE